MTIEFYRKGVEKPLVFPVKALVDAADAFGDQVLLYVEKPGQGFRGHCGNTISDFHDHIGEGKSVEEFFDVHYKAGDGLLLIDGGIAKAT